MARQRSLTHRMKLNSTHTRTTYRPPTLDGNLSYSGQEPKVICPSTKHHWAIVIDVGYLDTYSWKSSPRFSHKGLYAYW